MDSILTVAGITTLLVTIFTLIFQYFPGLRVKWAGLSGNIKRFVVLALYLGVGAFIGFGGCVEALLDLIPSLLCSTTAGFGEYVIAVLLAIGAGQGIFEFLPELSDVALARANR
jgi:hypothetical protein